MRKFYILFLILGIFFYSFGQNFTLTKLDGTPIADGSTLLLNTTQYPTAKIGLKVTNTSNSNIKLHLKVIGMTNGDGTGMETCFGGVCVNSVALNQVIPTAGLTLSPGQTNTDFDYVFNTNATSTTGNFPIDYIYEVYEVDSFGSVIQPTITFTYSYDPDALFVEDLENERKEQFVLSTNQIENEIVLTASTRGTAQLINAEGRLIQQWKLEEGKNTLFLSNAPAKGVYILYIEGETQNDLKKLFIQ